MRSFALAMILLSPALWAQRPVYPSSKHGGTYMFNYYLPPAPSTTPWWPSWSPDGKWIAVAMYGSIWKVDPQTGVAYELTYNGKYHSSPDWSPDGKWIVYTADDDGVSVGLEIVNVETGESHALTQDKEIYADPVFSPDGRRLAYVSTKPKGYFNIYVRPIKDGRWSGEEMALTTDNNFGRDRLYFGAWDMHTQPTWSPDGKEMLVVSNRDALLGAGNVWRVPVEPNGMVKAKSVLREQTLYRTRPDLSIDGKRLIYSSTIGAADQYNHLYVLPAAGGEPYKMTFGSHDDFHPRWSPDGEWIAYISNEGGLPQLRLLETYGGAQKTIRIQSRRWKRPMGMVRVRVLDERTRGVTAARVYAPASDTKFYPPEDAYARVSSPRMTYRLGEHTFHTEGDFTMAAPPGKMSIEAVKGFEYRPAKREVEIRTGEVANVVLTLKPLVDMSANGWYSGSTHTHMNYGGNLRNTLENMMMMSRAEDQDVVNVLVANKDNRILDWQHFVKGGGEHPVSKSDPSMKVIVGEEYRPPFWGHVFFIGLQDHLISPFLTGYEGTAIESLYPSNTDMFRKATAQGAVAGYVHAFGGNNDPLRGNLGGAKGFAVDAALGTIHAVEWSSSGRGTFVPLHHAWNNDLRIAAVGGEDANTSLHHHTMIASVRTYAYAGKQFTAATWIDAVKQGRTFFSNGPLLEFKVDGRIPGETVNLPGPGGTVTLEGKVWSWLPLTRITIYRDGKLWKEVGQDFREQVKVDRSGWFSLVAEGAPAGLPVDPAFPQAGTNAIRVYVGDQKIRNRESAEYFVAWIDKLRGMTEKFPGWRSQAEKEKVFAQFDEARRVYQKLAGEAAH
ncbi:MAG: CehA/McbA family metallohydrolase [Bryobacteraceae bacterium]